ncbi:glutamate synthase large subunit [Clostridium sp.]|uniref:glutamate synthase large subunit n=1 Tax=Clostridium sp. TaxID=1506 RepID=UPI001A62FD76|nr:glutamate synthase large subunit [Clostridium sp.]MBK5234749.1 glutamate synthase large subunit [Clostridium sp.]
MIRYGFPQKQGLYDPNMEKDNCGVGFVANIKGVKTHNILKQSLEILKNLKHRGAVGADATTGDGSGVMLQLPHEFFRKETKKSDIQLPNDGDYAVGMIFLPQEPNAHLFCEGIVERILREENQKVLGWREVAVNESACGELARATRPIVMQIFIDRSDQCSDEFERKLLVVRKRIQTTLLELKRPYTENFYICSLSSSTIIYKGLILGYMLDEFYLDLQDETVKTSIAVVHERYSTNTFPAWKLAQPFRFLAHNGEINTIRGNINWMNAREGVMHSNIFKEDFNKILPIIEPGGSDSASLDNALELFVANAHSMENAMMMLIPEAWQNDVKMDKEKRAYYQYLARSMEPWDGPATIIFTDGVKVGVTLDRNGLRPARYLVTKDNLVIMASEVGAVEIEPGRIIKKGRVRPGEMLLIDTKGGRIVPDDEIKAAAYNRKPFGAWIKRNKLTLQDLEQHHEVKKMRNQTLMLKQRIFGFTQEEIEKVIVYLVDNSEEPVSSMGIDIPLAVLSEKPQLLFNYFKQNFAQVTNPPIDPIREEIIMSLVQFIGSHGKLLDEIETEKDCKFIELNHPILTNKEIEDIRHLNEDDFRAITIPMTFEIDHENGLKEALRHLCSRAEESVIEGYNLLVLSDRNAGRYNAPIPSLLALSAVHHHLVQKKLRTAVDLIVEAGDVRDVMHVALLVGYGAKAINPYMVYEIIGNLIENKKYIKSTNSLKEGFENYSTAISVGLLKILSRMGISTLQSYNGAQIFQSMGINKEVIEEYFNGTPSRISGISLSDIEKEVLQRQSSAYENISNLEKGLDGSEDIFYKPEGEYHSLNSEVARKLRKASLGNDYKIYKEYIQLINEENEKISTIRGLLKFKQRNSIAIDQVESVDNIMKRFIISGMSFGSISKEAHETLAIAMNRIGGTSNSGEGGEDSSRYKLRENGDNPISRVKQIASGRFGVTTNYLVNCEEIQIKVAQGAKPGEGGHLPGGKVTEEIAKVRHSIAGIDLISPPPHHDIYSIEDLAQLVFDLKNVNPKARIGVKLVAEAGVGTVAAGVAKGYADVVMISGHDGGTGASAISSMKYVGLPWELGLAETQQTLLLNNLRSRITLQVDGKLKSGRDVVIAALLGAEEYGFATTALISLGCVMCRQCNKNRCAVGIATQDPKLRARFKGTPEHLINYLTFIAKEVREIMAELGVKTIDEIIGRVDFLEVNELKKDKLNGLDLSPVLYKPELPSRIIGKCVMAQKHKINNVLDKELIKLAKDALEKRVKVSGSFNVKNTFRAVGTMLSGAVAKIYGDEGLPEDTITLNFKGSAGQSFGAFAVKGLKLILEGESNDYLGKGLSGGKIILVPLKESTFIPHENTIAGNTLLYGATSGEVYIQGRVGERFCVRNSGATAVVEGIGDHGCEYMTGGIVVILGSVGKNFGAGMSGGIAYVLDEAGDFYDKCNTQIVEIKPLENKDTEVVKKLIETHYKYTKSSKAKAILADWNLYERKFLKVISPIYESKLGK